MCWTSNKLPKMCIAEQDMRVYKIVRSINNFLCSSAVQNFQYQYKILYTQEKPILVQPGYTASYRIEKGFHSYKTYFKAKKAFYKFSECSLYNDTIIVECIIPKDSIFYENKNGEIVSDRIIINRILKTDAKLPCAWTIIQLFIIILLSCFILFKVFTN